MHASQCVRAKQTIRLLKLHTDANVAAAFAYAVAHPWTRTPLNMHLYHVIFASHVGGLDHTLVLVHVDHALAWVKLPIGVRIP